MHAPADPPLAFRPPRIYVLREAWEHPAAARRAERLAAACPGAEVRTWTYDDLPGIVAEEGWDRFPRMGQLDPVPPPALLLGLFRYDREALDRDVARMKAAYRGPGGFAWHRAAGGGSFTWFCSGQPEPRPAADHVCRPQWRLNWGRGCPHQCAYCALGGVLLQHLNIEDYLDRLADLLRENPWQKTFLLDDNMDVLTLEPQLDGLAPTMRFFERTGDRFLVLHTKSDRIEPLLRVGAPHHTILCWSLAGPTQTERLERMAGTTEGRIEAARLAQAAGFPVRYKFKPIVPVRRWREDATFTIGRALERTRPDNLSMTVLMWMDAAALRACIPPDLLDPEFLAAADAAAATAADGERDRNGPFPEAMRERVYRHYLAEVRARDPRIPLTISTESLSMWKRLGADLGFSPSDYVCGCGAGAVPNRGRLQTNPWLDAQAARTWDGQPDVGVDGR